MSLSPTTQVPMIGKYRILSLLGAGGMGRVYLAEHEVLRKPVALKVLPLTIGHDESLVRRFQREARAAAMVQHPNIIQAYDFDKDEKLYFIVMEYSEGLTVSQYVDRFGPIPIPQAAYFAKQTASALDHAHHLGLVHRDIKPGNLIINLKGELKLLDLGLVVVRDDVDTASLTSMNPTILGTADYLAPEQAMDSHNVDIRADLYSLGSTFYFMLTGRPPFPKKTMAEKLLAHQTSDPEPITQFIPDCPTYVSEIVAKLMAKQRDERFQSPAEVVTVLETIAEPLQTIPFTVADIQDARINGLLKDKSNPLAQSVIRDGRIDSLAMAQDLAQLRGSSPQLNEMFDSPAPSTANGAGDQTLLPTPPDPVPVEIFKRKSRFPTTFISVLLVAGASLAAMMMLQPSDTIPISELESRPSSSEATEQTFFSDRVNLLTTQQQLDLNSTCEKLWQAQRVLLLVMIEPSDPNLNFNVLNALKERQQRVGAAIQSSIALTLDSSTNNLYVYWESQDRSRDRSHQLIMKNIDREKIQEEIMRAIDSVATLATNQAAKAKNQPKPSNRSPREPVSPSRKEGLGTRGDY